VFSFTLVLCSGTTVGLYDCILHYGLLRLVVHVHITPVHTVHHHELFGSGRVQMVSFLQDTVVRCMSCIWIYLTVPIVHNVYCIVHCTRCF
jgi:hypothetical protein